MSAIGNTQSSRVRRPRRWAAALLLASLVVGSVAGCAGSSTAQAGAPGVGAALPSAVSTGTGSPATGAATPVKPLARSVPVRLEIPSIGVDTTLMQLGLNPDGTVQVPPIEANAPAGWYRNSVTPGQTGPAVILAHVTVGQFGNGVFLHLSRLKPGDQVTVLLQDGASAVFTVDSVQLAPKSSFPTTAVYGNVDHPALRLITCGGPRGADGTGYPDNVIVYASLTSGSGD